MNRLILLGNGFDLAHGMKTGYNDFIIWYLINALEKALHDGNFTDGLITVTRVQGIWNHYYDRDKIPDFINFFYCKGSLQPLFENKISYDNGTQHQNPYKIVVHSDFMASLFADCSMLNWVDIENKYYSALKDIINPESKKISVKNILEPLNKTMEAITKKLELYLNDQKPGNSDYSYDEIFKLPILQNEFVHWDKVENPALEQTLILNFNYTPTIDLYRASSYDAASSCTVNYIHGQLSRPKNPMIFGFGDELDENYKRLEDHPTKGLFKHIKSFGYFKTRNYHNLIRYIESGQYQVFILGHSCGLSDRTMLNMIFEHDNCMSIKIYYYEIDEHSNNYTELTEEISRHFKNKLKMRERIVSLEDCRPMPQIHP